ncbi:MAG: hypothetical protein CSA26_08360 [Desulfobacterales bacterium]|nr:MAG: hypothetical protein CSA26_08360 [Desulfobacterales bacterium]
MSAEKDILKEIPDSKPVRIFLPIIDSKERYRLQCVYQKTVFPRFNLLFKAGTLPVKAIDCTQNCIVSIDKGGPYLSLEAQIVSITNSQTLEMIVHKMINHEQMREFFRVDTTTRVIGKSFQPEFFGKKEKPWCLQGQTIDISGNGILASFSEQPPMDDQIRLEITLPTTPPELIKVLARPVRSLQVADNQWDAAYYFDDISDEDRDKIIGCCLVIQRRMLQLKVNVKDQEKL